MKALHGLFILLGLLSVILLAISGPLYKSGSAELGTAFLMLRWAAYIGAATFVLNIIWYLIRRPQGFVAGLSGLAIIAGGFAFYMPFSQYLKAQNVPAIHDITTDTQNPPEFVAIAPLRADASNPVEYPGEETAKKQRKAYPELSTFQSLVPPDELFSASLAVVDKMGWELVASSKAEGRIEATATTTWFGFKDDVVIRIRPTADGSELDIRSKSRVGRSDVGKNAERIRTFIMQLESELK
ncbi:DUF1499 domain-containing protein [Idiomarina sp. HP20-50]|uniref:DUF1499 domain-containing protein n=1 Tax=Idiomarina sp. HP20-50 TaxID=3070813 RepID=UPI00294B18B5|nr:DUF1499 domain-containing protein [Idiomarina sp. HP20-50]MDV6317007.1 DUF1499 domain-containing protein [Idiomarina sp. HP20-50]